MLIASDFLDCRDDWCHSGLQSALSSAGETPAAFSGSPDGTRLPEKAVEGSGGGGVVPLFVKAILQDDA
ncbi:unnamed protein product [Staurois parvus]|uniref:Uncharacterized protein n=1 Tax=Staurois parvus TaxID=386267 RepID=A0ABN9AY20_9NEOB|nr:unnamed protein product [Staurois parvus]